MPLPRPRPPPHPPHREIPGLSDSRSPRTSVWHLSPDFWKAWEQLCTDVCVCGGVRCKCVFTHMCMCQREEGGRECVPLWTDLSLTGCGDMGTFKARSSRFLSVGHGQTQRTFIEHTFACLACIHPHIHTHSSQVHDLGTCGHLPFTDEKSWAPGG